MKGNSPLLKLGRRLLIIYCVIGGLLAAHGRLSNVAEAQASACPGSAFTFSETMSNNAVWQMCWSDSAYDGVTLWGITYTPPGGPARLILHEARLAQIFVPYDDNSNRFYDVTDYGLGQSAYRVNLAAGECPGGTLLQNNGVNVLCKTRLLNQPHGYKNGTSYKLSSGFTLWSASKIGFYTYIQKWLFHDDGTIEPVIGATGQLQSCTSNALYGGAVGPTSARCTGTTPYGTGHVHNYYWYFDFDLGGSTNDQPNRIEAPGAETSYTRSISSINLTTETAQRFAQSNLRFWRIRDTVITNSDGHNISYELGANSSQTFYGPEGSTKNDIFFTQHASCERYPSHNTRRQGCGGDDLPSFVTGQSITDVVVWYRASFHHVPHDEDDNVMSTHWTSFPIIPRDMTATNQR